MRCCYPYGTGKVRQSRLMAHRLSAFVEQLWDTMRAQLKCSFSRSNDASIRFKLFILFYSIVLFNSLFIL